MKLIRKEKKKGEGGEGMEGRRRDKGLVRLNERDLLLLNWIGDQYAVRLDSLRLMLGRHAHQPTQVPGQVKESTARRVIERWQQEGLVVTRKYFFREPEWVSLTSHGLRQLDLPFKFWQPKVGALSHLHLVNQIRLRAEANYSDLQAWHSERMLRYERHEAKDFHVPDGEVLTKQNQVVAVEVERTLKSRSRVKQIVAKLARHYARTWFFVTPATQGVVASATEGYGTRFRLYDLTELKEN